MGRAAKLGVRFERRNGASSAQDPPPALFVASISKVAVKPAAAA
jgi:hypothetical protein